LYRDSYKNSNYNLRRGTVAKFKIYSEALWRAK
jgi:hypothetical protein